MQSAGPISVLLDNLAVPSKARIRSICFPRSGSPGIRWDWMASREQTGMLQSSRQPMQLWLPRRQSKDYRQATCQWGTLLPRQASLCPSMERSEKVEWHTHQDSVSQRAESCALLRMTGLACVWCWGLLEDQTSGLRSDVGNERKKGWRDPDMGSISEKSQIWRECGKQPKQAPSMGNQQGVKWFVAGSGVTMLIWGPVQPNWWVRVLRNPPRPPHLEGWKGYFLNLILFRANTLTDREATGLHSKAGKQFKAKVLPLPLLQTWGDQLWLETLTNPRPGEYSASIKDVQEPSWAFHLPQAQKGAQIIAHCEEKWASGKVGRESREVLHSV